MAQKVHPLAIGTALLAAAASSAPIINFSTFLGGGDFDQIFAVALDASGNIYVTGQTASSDFPLRASGQTGNRDIFVAKLDPTGSRLIYSTVLGGSQTEQPKGIAVDASGNAYVTGYTGSTDFPTTPGAYRTSASGMEDAFVVKLDANGAVAYSTYLGGSDRDFASAIAVDSAGNAYVAGYTHSSNFPIAGGAFQSTYGGGYWDAFVTKLNATGSSLVYSTLIGGAGNDIASAIALDSSGNVYVCGQTDSANFPLSKAVQAANAGGMDAFVAELNTTGSGLLFSTYLGGSSSEVANAIAVDSARNIFVAGATASIDFPVSANAAQASSAGMYDAFVAKISPNNPALVFATLLGGAGSDTSSALAIDLAGNVWMAGSTSSATFPMLNPIQAQNAGASDAFVATVSAAGTQLLFASYLGGSMDDAATALAIDNKGGAVVVGNTGSPNFVTTAGALQRVFGGSYDGFIAKLQTGICGYTVSPLLLGIGGGGGSGAITVTVPSGCAAPTASSNVAWASVSVAGSSANWSVGANPSSQNRGGALSVASQSVTLIQSGAACSYTVNPASINAAAGGSSGNIAVTPAPGDCPSAAASSSVNWATVSVSGNSAAWTVSANTSTQSRSGSFTIGGKAVAISQPGASAGTLTLSRSSLNFATSGAQVTGAQTILVTFPGGNGVVWTASSNRSNITVAPTSASGVGSFTVTASAGLSGVVTVTAAGAANSPQQVQINVAPAGPGWLTGSFDTPANGSTGIAGAIPVTGWALDPLEVTKVDIWREPAGGEPISSSLIYLGDAVFVAGARPDVESGNPSTPWNYRAGWGYLLLTNFLPNNGGSSGSGNGTYRLHAIAHSKTGASVDLGPHTVTVDNAHASRPFGTIDTPPQGATISGASYVNFGWALTQNPYIIPVNGLTITVTVDGVPLGHPTYNQYRSDIANAFPGLANSGGAVGYFIIDTTTLTNGVHTIGWVVYDNQGRGDGIGSRFFNVLNGGPGGVAAMDLPPPALDGRAATPDRGWIDVEVEELERIELNLGAAHGYSLVAGEPRPLPAGSSLQAGSFHWHPGPGFLGDYVLIFERTGLPDVGVRVTIRPKR